MGVQDTVIPAVVDASTVDDTTIGVTGAGKLQVKDGGVDTTQIADDAVSLAKLAAGTAGKIIGFDGSGDPTELDRSLDYLGKVTFANETSKTFSSITAYDFYVLKFIGMRKNATTGTVTFYLAVNGVAANYAWSVQNVSAIVSGSGATKWTIGNTSSDWDVSHQAIQVMGKWYQGATTPASLSAFGLGGSAYSSGAKFQMGTIYAGTVDTQVTSFDITSSVGCNGVVELWGGNFQ